MPANTHPPLHCDAAGDALLQRLDRPLDESMAEALEQHLAHCADCAAVAARIGDWQSLADALPTEDVPKWSRAREAVRPVHSRRAPWWAWTSLSASAASVLFVLSLLAGQVRIVHSSEGVQLAWGSAPQEALLTRADVQQMLTLHTQTLQASFETRLLENDLKNQQNNKRVLTAVLEHTREQQREDFAQLVNYYSTLRETDKASTRDTFNRLLSVQRANRNDIQQLKANLKPATDLETL